MAAVTSPARHAASLATSGSNRERRQSKVHRAMEWPKPSSVRSNVTMSASVRARMHRPSCTSSQLGLITTTRFTPTRLSDIVHPVSSSQLTAAPDLCPVVRGLQAVFVPIAAAAASPLLEWRGPVYILAGFAGMIALGFMLVQPLLIAGYLPGLSAYRGRRWCCPRLTGHPATWPEPE